MAQPRGPRESLVGRKFGRWVVVSFADYGDHENLSKYAMWNCVCECGTKRKVIGRNLLYGLTESCGCLANETTSARNRTHGMTYSPEYNAWSAMWQRARGTSEKIRYFDRGIDCCDRWKSFEKFYEDMGPRPVGHTLDRKDNDKGYSPDNCRWATPKQQARNRGTNLIVHAYGKSLTLAEWADLTGLDYHVLWARIAQLGWDPEKALTTSVERKVICLSI